jgi:outer membrane immunogenic protein
MLRNLLLSSAAATAMVGSALAADLPRRAPPAPYVPPPPVFTWTGFYIGVNAGGIWANNRDDNRLSAVPGPCDARLPGCTAVPNISTLSANAINLSVANNNNNGNRGAFIGGGQIGFNWQVGPSFVLGVEADFQGVAGNNNNNNNSFNAPLVLVNPAFPAERFVQIGGNNLNNRQLSYLGTLRGRAGFLVTPSFLIYGTGGLAYGGFRNNNNNSFIVQAELGCTGPGTSCVGVLGNGNNGSNNRVGYTLGGGLEWMFLPNWSLKAEALYYDLGRNNNNNAQVLNVICNANCGVPGGVLGSSLITQNNTRTNGVIARAGINYHFSWGAAPAPVVARY